MGEITVKNIYAKNVGCGYYSHYIADELKKFIEDSTYENIIKVFIYGETNKSLVCTILYEIKNEDKSVKS